MKLCWWCSHFYYSNSYPAYSEMTPGSDFSVSCDKQHWIFESDKTTQEEFGVMLSAAESCKDFEHKETSLRKLAKAHKVVKR